MPIANFFSRPHYTSDATDFLEQLQKKRPTLREEQLHGHGLLWDKDIDREEQAAFYTAQVPQTAYVYYQNDV